MRPFHAVFAASVLLYMSGGAAEPLGKTSPPAYAYRGTHCGDAYFVVLADAAAVRKQVPASFNIVGEPAGKAVLFVTFTSCDLSLNGAPPERGSFSDVGALIVDPDLTTGNIVLYRLWNLTTLPEMARLNAAWGVPTAVVPGITLTDMPALLVSSATGSVPWQHGAYAMSAVYGPVHTAVPGTASWWTQGPAGRLRFDQQFVNDTEKDAAGVIDSAPGSPLAQLIGDKALGQTTLTYADLLGHAIQR